MQRVRLERITKLGRLGEDLVAERLQDHGFSKIKNLNLRRNNYPFGHLLATRGGVECATYQCLARDRSDARVTLDLLNT